MNLVELAKTECSMIEEAEEEFKEYYRFASESIGLLNNFINSVNIDGQVFLIFMSQIQKSTVLAVLSTLRRHDVQALMSVRHLLESYVLIIYSFVEKDFDSYVYQSKNRYAIERKDVKVRARKWLESQYPEYSNRIKNMKLQINDFYAHANLLSAFTNYDFTNESSITLKLFDKKEDIHIKQRLWWIGNISFGVADLIIKVNQRYPLVIFNKDTNEKMVDLALENNVLQEELMNLPNFLKHAGMTLE